MKAMKTLLIGLQHPEILGPTKRHIIPNRIQVEDGLVIRLIDHRKATRIPHHKSIKGAKKGVVFGLEGSDHGGGQLLPCRCVDVLGCHFWLPENPMVCAQTPIHDLDPRRCEGLEILNHRDMDVHTKESHLRYVELVV
jgi:hypothetical protein